MNEAIVKFNEWLFNLANKALDRAYNTSKQIFLIQKEYLAYKNIVFSSQRSWQSVVLYIDSEFSQCVFKIKWNLIQFRIYKYLIDILCTFYFKNFISFFNPNRYNKFSEKLEVNKEIFNSTYPVDDSVSKCTTQSLFDISIQKNKKSYNKKFNNYNLDINDIKSDSENNFNKLLNNSQESSLKKMEKKIEWIEAVLGDLSTWKSYHLEIYLSNTIKNSKNNGLFIFNKSTSSPTLALAYESIGLIPRSITRTLSRFQSELAGRSYPLIMKEFRIAKYYTLASLQYVFSLLFLPWITNLICRKLFLESYLENWWNTNQSQIFLNISQEEQALKRLQDVEELLWLDIAIAEPSQGYPQDLTAQIHQRTVQLADLYNHESLETVIHVFTDFIYLFTLILLLIFGKKRVAIFNAWIQELFYSLTDTMKAFLILLLTDLFIGFHSPHGWEIAIGDLLDHFGFAHNKYLISCLVSTFPVILDTVIKYWIFRHLNRISPSIVVTYHTMNE
uniref:Potassium/proton antiporter CemA n=1 Tax=Coleochaete scutata TaxID=3125 RepID=A0A191T5I1_COLSC|nr:chloroplast enveloppe membrane protein [Coleochaete scutata]ANI25649.1 chloroplast enveloppe membrane protein [Coleochaete scutata]